MRSNRIDAAWQGTAECRRCAVRDLVLFSDLCEPDFGVIHVPIDELKLAPRASLYHAGEEGTGRSSRRTRG